jgi:TRAP-type transport system periplasmic protein
VDCGAEFQTNTRRENQEAVESMQKRGLQVHPVSKEAEEQWRKFSESMYPQIRGHIVPADTFDKVMQLLHDYRAAQGASAK